MEEPAKPQHPTQRRYPRELRERAVRMVLDISAREGSSEGVIPRVAKQLDVSYEALRKWVRQAQVDQGQRSGTSTVDRERIVALEKENKDLRRANEILKAAASFFARELDPRMPK